MATISKPQKNSPIIREDFDQRPLGRNNFILMAVSGVLIVLGFLLMLGSGSTPEQFNPDIFSTRRIVVGPAICFIGFVLMVVAVWIKPKK